MVLGSSEVAIRLSAQINVKLCNSSHCKAVKINQINLIARMIKKIFKQGIGIAEKSHEQEGIAGVVM